MNRESIIPGSLGLLWIMGALLQAAQLAAFTGYYHSNGKWFRQYSVTIPMTDPVYIGMVVTSHVAGTLCTAQIDRACSTNFIPADLVPDDIVNFKDYSELILNWLDENEWPLP